MTEQPEKKKKKENNEEELRPRTNRPNPSNSLVCTCWPGKTLQTINPTWRRMQNGKSRKITTGFELRTAEKYIYKRQRAKEREGERGKNAKFVDSGSI